jgi:hypothetical protein
MSITLTATNPTARVARAAVLGALGMGELAHHREIILTIHPRTWFANGWCEEGNCTRRAIGSAEYVDTEDGVTEHALCAICMPGALAWLRMSDGVDHAEDITINACSGWLQDAHKFEM